ncbi:hypothetical protein [Vogesella indigofera]|uniref:hypothetical protein n=1 Tax=Vogesella indigofera TaxID=45465 RepID=UPI00234EDCCC|nr:hypothetical protein [Vogesella indigofera]MDC7701656.1 hypothetical protein [Vogesella indigofera]
MKITARIEQPGALGPDPWDDDWGICLPLDHVICRDLDGTPHTVGEFTWPWTAYTAHQKTLSLHFFYWNQISGKVGKCSLEISPEREARIRELQFLMTRLIYYGNDNAPSTLDVKLRVLHNAARFAEARSCTVRDILTQTSLLDACGASLADNYVGNWMSWLTFLGQLEPEIQLGFTLATPKQWRDLERRVKLRRDNRRQIAPLPTRIYANLINNLATELDDIEAHKPQLLMALREAIVEYRRAKEKRCRIFFVPALVEKHGLAAYFAKRGFYGRGLRGMVTVISEVFQICKLQIHVFSGMRDSEARHLPYHCMETEKGPHGRMHCLIVGTTTKFNNGRCLQTKWITTDREGFRAIRLAQEFAAVIYEALGIMSSKADDLKDEQPLFPSLDYLPWRMRQVRSGCRISAFIGYFSGVRGTLQSRLCPIIEGKDIEELEEIDPFRAWREEPEFFIGRPWPLAPHQLRRSLAIYANASGLVRLSSLRRQLQHITREMAMYYGRGSTFCKNFIESDAKGYNKHFAVEWQNGAEEAEMLAFVCDVLHSKEQMFGGAGNYYERQRERGEVMSSEEVARQMKAGLLAYREGPLGGCTRPGVCETRKGLNLIDTVCATDGCKYLIGKHSKIVQTIRLKRAAMANITIGSVTAAMEQEELEALERVEREWRPEKSPEVDSIGGGHA